MFICIICFIICFHWPRKAPWGSGQLRYICTIYLTVWLQVVLQICSAAAFVVVVVVLTAVGRLLSVLVKVVGVLVQPEG